MQKKYFAYAQTLGENLNEYEPDTDFVTFLAGRLSPQLLEDKLEYCLIPAEELGLADIHSMAFRYDIKQLVTSIKSACFLFTLNKLGTERAIYLDSDIQIFTQLEKVRIAFADGASCVLTPHLLAPLTDDKTPTTLDFLWSGTFNLGFAAFANGAESTNFLEWWHKQLVQEGHNDLSRSLFVDQKYMEFAASFLPKLHILRDQDYNVAYRNLAHRPVTEQDGQYLAANQPLVFFHISGVLSGHKDIFPKHQSRLDMVNSLEARGLVQNYLDALDRHGLSEWSKAPYTYGTFNDGSPVFKPHRRSPPPNLSPEDWRSSRRYEYWNTPSDYVKRDYNIVILRLIIIIHKLKSDLMTLFLLSKRDGRLGLQKVPASCQERVLSKRRPNPASSSSVIRCRAFASTGKCFEIYQAAAIKVGLTSSKARVLSAFTYQK